jgi:hypothetical protein
MTAPLKYATLAAGVLIALSGYSYAGADKSALEPSPAVIHVKEGKGGCCGNDVGSSAADPKEGIRPLAFRAKPVHAKEGIGGIGRVK